MSFKCELLPQRKFVFVTDRKLNEYNDKCLCVAKSSCLLIHVPTNTCYCRWSRYTNNNINTDTKMVTGIS